MQARLAALFGAAPALREGVRRLTQACGAKAVLDQRSGHRQAIGLGAAPAFGGEAAVERDAAPGAGDPARSVCGWRCHDGSLRVEEDEGKIVINAQTNPCMALA